MNLVSLQRLGERVVDAGRLSLDDLRVLRDECLPDGIACRDEADLLLALDRAVADQDAGFADFLVAAIVDFAVWGERPTGTITGETAAWLSASLSGRGGPTATGRRLAMEIVREAHVSDDRLIAFALEANAAPRRPSAGRAPGLALAA